MPSKGSPVVKFRCPPELKAWIDAQVARSETHRFAGAHTVSSFVVSLIEEGRRKRARSARSRGKAKAQPQPGATP